jgi:hypothetical protein
MKYARIQNTYAVDVRSDSPEGCYTPNIVAEFVQVPDEVMHGWILTDGTWAAPVIYTPSAEELAVRAEAQLAATKEALSASVRIERNAKLAASDWTQISDSTADKATWATYRQELRDISAQAGFPWTVVWPTQPV